MNSRKWIFLGTLTLAVAAIAAIAPFARPPYYRYVLFDAGGQVNDRALLYFHSLGPARARLELQKALAAYPLAALHDDQFWFYSQSAHGLTHYELAKTYVVAGGLGGAVHDGMITSQGPFPWSGKVGPIKVPADWVVQQLHFDAAGQFHIDYLNRHTGARWSATLNVPTWEMFPEDWSQARL